VLDKLKVKAKQLLTLLHSCYDSTSRHTGQAPDLMKDQ
jgi:hypothetical protein